MNKSHVQGTIKLHVGLSPEMIQTRIFLLIFRFTDRGNWIIDLQWLAKDSWEKGLQNPDFK